MSRTKILCLCSGGNIRSVHTAALLKHTRNGYDALAAGVHTLSRESLTMLCGWADKILICGNNLQQEVPQQFQSKAIQLGIGEDRWGWSSLQDDLLELADQELRKVGL